MPNDLNKIEEPQPAESHWMTQNPEAQPARDAVAGLPRMVLETQSRLGPDATPEAVSAELQARGVDASPDDVRECSRHPY